MLAVEAGLMMWFLLLWFLSTAVVSAVTPARRQRHQQQLADCTSSAEDEETAGAASCILTVRVVGAYAEPYARVRRRSGPIRLRTRCEREGPALFPKGSESIEHSASTVTDLTCNRISFVISYETGDIG